MTELPSQPLNSPAARLNDHLAELIVNAIHPAIVLHVGCGAGLLVAALRERGVKAWGVDSSEAVIAQAPQKIRPYCWVGSLAEPFTRNYDLIVCLDALQALSPLDVERAIANCCQHADDILFSSSLTEWQQLDDWAEQFAQHGFFRDVDFDASFIAPWAARFSRMREPLHRVVHHYERRLWSLSQQNRQLEQTTLALREQLSHWEQLQQSPGWRVLSHLQKLRARLLPPGSRRDQWLEAAWRAWRDRSTQNGHAKEIPAPPIANVTASNAEMQRDPYQAWIAAHEPDERALACQREAARSFAYQPLISFIVPVYNPPSSVLRDTIESVRAQTYANWELCLANSNSQRHGVQDVLSEFAARDGRVRVKGLERNLGIAGNSNAALDMARGEFIALLDHDDLLAPNMLFEVVQLLNDPRDADADIIYFDEDKLSADGAQRRDPMFKPHRWSPELMLSANCLMHAVVRRQLIREAGGFDPQTDGVQDWDLLLRCSERTDKIVHIAKVLYHWRQLPNSAATTTAVKPWAIELQPKVIANHLRRIGLNDVSYRLIAPGRFHFTWPTRNSKVSIIIATKDQYELLRACLESLFARTAYANYEVILVDTGSTDERVLHYYDELSKRQPCVHVVHFREPFNYAAANNLGAQQATGDLLLFLNNDVEILEAGWLAELVRWAERSDIGAVGAQLLYPDGRVQHAGVVVGLGHIFNDAAEDYVSSFFGAPYWYRNYTAVTGACLMLRHAVFGQVGGFNESFALAFGDVDLCIRIVNKGYRNVYTPYARLRHHEGATRANYVPEPDHEAARQYLRDILEGGDPYFNPNLSLSNGVPSLTVDRTQQIANSNRPIAHSAHHAHRDLRGQVNTNTAVQSLKIGQKGT